MRATRNCIKQLLQLPILSYLITMNYCLVCLDFFEIDNTRVCVSSQVDRGTEHHIICCMYMYFYASM